MGSAEIENQIAEDEKELEKLLNNLKIVEQAKLTKQNEKIELQKKIDDLRIETNNLSSRIKEGRFLVQKKELEIKLLTKDFWAAKNRGG